jgi:GNAT superfamily N-acetyltransferase
MVQRVSATLLLVGVDAEDAGMVSCGMGVLDGEHFGLFNLVTHSEYRRRGYGTALVRAMRAWSRERGAARSYLQVAEENVVARRVYGGLEFELAYPYWYRVRS